MSKNRWNDDVLWDSEKARKRSKCVRIDLKTGKTEKVTTISLLPPCPDCGGKLTYRRRKCSRAVCLCLKCGYHVLWKDRAMLSDGKINEISAKIPIEHWLDPEADHM